MFHSVRTRRRASGGNFILDAAIDQVVFAATFADELEAYAVCQICVRSRVTVILSSLSWQLFFAAIINNM
jgi:hypothetical protein